jgi:hypothetical protein
MNLTEWMITRTNKVIPQCALNTEIGPTGLRDLHPTKGWRRVSYRRLGFPRGLTTVSDA